MIAIENKKTIERHGCLVCAKIFSLLVIYSPTGKLVDFAVISPGGLCIQNESQALVACNSHTSEEKERALQKWRNSRIKPMNDDQEQN